jgi:hypothetical protein
VRTADGSEWKPIMAWPELARLLVSPAVAKSKVVAGVLGIFPRIFLCGVGLMAVVSPNFGT